MTRPPPRPPLFPTPTLSQPPAALRRDALMADLLTAQNLRKEFGGLTAVNDVDFTVPEGSIVSLIGPNGAGKTTFLDRKSTRLNSSHLVISYAVFCLKKKNMW